MFNSSNSNNNSNDQQDVELVNDKPIGNDPESTDAVQDEIAQNEDRILSETYGNQTQAQQDQVYDQLQYQKHLITPDAKLTYSDIDKDMVTANLEESEVVWIKLREKYAGEIDYLIKKGLDLTKLKQKVKRTIYITLNVSLSRNGFLRKELGTARTKFGREEQQERTKLPYGFAKRS